MANSTRTSRYPENLNVKIREADREWLEATAAAHSVSIGEVARELLAAAHQGTHGHPADSYDMCDACAPVPGVRAG